MPAPVSRPLARALALLLAVLGSLLVAGCSKDSGSKEAFCAQVRKVPALEAVLARFSEADPDVLQDRIDQARTAYDDLADAAPSEIRNETAQVVGLVNDVLDAVEQNPSDPAKASDQLREAMADHKGVDDDRTKVAAYASKECGVQLDATLTDSTSTSTTAPTGSGSTTSTTGG